MGVWSNNVGQVPVGPQGLKHVAIVLSIVGSQDRDEGCSGCLQAVAHTVVNMQTALAIAHTLLNMQNNEGVTFFRT